MIDLSCPDWQDRIKTGRSLVPDGLPIADRALADAAVGMFNLLRLPDVPGCPSMSEAAGDWQRDIVHALFGSFDRAANVRHVREIFCMVPKKSSKTTAGAAIMLTAVMLSQRPRAEFLIVAPTQEVADLAFRQAVGMIEADSTLRALFHIQEHIKRITFRRTGAFLKVKSFDPKVVTGSKPSGVLLDELHVIAEAHDADRVIGQLRGGLVSQPEGFLLTITTQSERPPAGVFRAELMKARAVRDGRLRAPILPLLYEFPPDVDWRDPSNWHMVTPNNGRSISVDRLLPDYYAALEAGDDELRRWASQHLNVEIGLALMHDRWAGADFWERQGEPGLTLDEVIRRSEVLVVGIDGGGLDDLLGLCVMGREAGTGRWLMWAHAYVQPVGVERRKMLASKYADFERDGDLTITTDPIGDLRGCAAVTRRVYETGKLAQVVLDPEKTHKVILEALEAEGIPKELIVGMSQGWRLVGAITVAERKLCEGMLVHGARPMMAWCVGNAKVEPRGNAVLITKQAAGSGKIDPLMAMFNAVEVMSRNPAAPGRSFWEVAA